MSKKNKTETEQADSVVMTEPPVSIETDVELVPALPSAPAVEQVAAVEAPALRAFQVEIPGCLLGKLNFIATDGNDALRQYKLTGGITSHMKPAVVAELMPDCEAYKAALEAAGK